MSFVAHRCRELESIARRTIATSWSRIVDCLTDHQPATTALINPSATAADLRHLQSALNRPLPADLVELLELANGGPRASLIPTLYNLVPVKDMLSARQLQRRVQQQIYGPGPWSGDDDPAGRPTTGWLAGWLDSFLPIADAGDAGLLYG